MHKHLIPAPGKSVPDPERGGLLPADGRNVEINQYWAKRLAEGDVVEGDAPAAAKPATE